MRSSRNDPVGLTLAVTERMTASPPRPGDDDVGVDESASAPRGVMAEIDPPQGIPDGGGRA